MTVRPGPLLLCAAVLVAAVLRAQGTPVPLLPSTPHRVLQVSGDPASYYLIEEDKPLAAACDGPGLLTLTVRRAIMADDPPVATTSVRLAIDDDVKPPLVFRRAREEGAKFSEETRFFPSAPRTTKLAVPAGSHLVKIELGQQTFAVAVAMTFTPVAAVARAIDPALPRSEPLPPLQPLPPAEPLPPLEPLVRTPPPPTGLTVEEAASGSAPAVATAPAALEPTRTLVTDSQPADEPGLAPAAATVAAVATPVAEVGAAPRRPVRRSLGLGFDAGFGLATTFINLGAPAPTFRLGGRYWLPWLDRQLSVGLDVSLVRYAMFTRAGAAEYLEAANWIVPLQLVAAFAPRLDSWLHLEGGLSAGVAFNDGTLAYRGRAHSRLGVGGVAGLYGESGVHLGPGIVYGRLQADAVSASNAIFDHFDYLGSSLFAGYRLVF